MLTAQEQAVVDAAAKVVKGIFDQLPPTSDAAAIENGFVESLAAQATVAKQTPTELVLNVCAVANASAALSGNTNAIKITGDLTKTVEDILAGKEFATIGDLVVDYKDIHAALKGE